MKVSHSPNAWHTANGYEKLVLVVASMLAFSTVRKGTKCGKFASTASSRQPNKVILESVFFFLCIIIVIIPSLNIAARMVNSKERTIHEKSVLEWIVWRQVTHTLKHRRSYSCTDDAIKLSIHAHFIIFMYNPSPHQYYRIPLRVFSCWANVGRVVDWPNNNTSQHQPSIICNLSCRQTNRS